MTGDTVVELQTELRSELKEPLGPIYTETDELLAAAGRPLVAVGDVVTDHLIKAGKTPAVALVDERTERDAVDPEITARLSSFDGFDTVREVSNPPATLGEALLRTLRTAIESEASTLIEVDGEEDLAALPAAVIAPSGASLIYGQPGEGMVLAEVTPEARERARDLLSRMDGDTDRLWSLLGVDT